jgi:HAMP domain-containing protein
MDREPWLVALAGKWPLALLLTLLLIAFSSHLRRIFGATSKLVRKVSAGGVEMEISSEAADQVRQHLKGSFRELVSSARDEYERMADLQDVDLRLKAAVDEHLIKAFPEAKGLRSTIHVRDIIFKDYLYQLLDYYPGGGGAHRRFSQRYGIIGRSWRSKKSHGTGSAFAAARSEEELVAQWGMTDDEARGKLKAKPSCLSILLRSDGLLVGVLYADADTVDAFGTTAQAQTLVDKLEGVDEVRRLATAVERTLAPLRTSSPNLDIKRLG